MSENELKQLLNRLNEALENTDKVDAETLALVRELDEEIHRLTESGAEAADYDNVLDQAKSVETRFAVDHPVAERFLREIIDALSRVGI
jgi:phage terminase Nu1 subunit (DNA packaging protein)